jgi:hypothetical protein
MGTPIKTKTMISADNASMKLIDVLEPYLAEDECEYLIAYLEKESSTYPNIII